MYSVNRLFVHNPEILIMLPSYGYGQRKEYSKLSGPLKLKTMLAR